MKENKNSTKNFVSGGAPMPQLPHEVMKNAGKPGALENGSRAGI